MILAESRSKTLDLLVSFCTLWIACGFFLDAWAHWHFTVETFFTPYHAVFYSGMLAIVAVLAVYALRMRGLPADYRYPVIGIAIFICGGILDLIKHSLFGFEEGIDAVLSPTHQLLGLGIFFMASAPIISALRGRSQLRTLSDQLPLIFGLATWLELIHFGTSYTLDPGAGRMNAPPSIAPFTPDYLSALAFGYYKTGTGLLTVLFQSVLIAGFALFAGTRFRLRFGALTIIYVLGNFAIAALYTNDTPLFAAVMVMSFAAGIVGDTIVACTRPDLERVAYRVLGAAVPATYFGAYFIFMGITGGVWWDWDVMLGAVLWAGVIGFGLTLLLAPRMQSA